MMCAFSLFYLFILDSSELESLTLVTLSGYQKISPDIFLQVNFNPAKLLPTLTLPLDGAHDHDNLVLSLKLNIGAQRESFNQVCLYYSLGVPL